MLSLLLLRAKPKQAKQNAVQAPGEVYSVYFGVGSVPLGLFTSSKVFFSFEVTAEYPAASKRHPRNSGYRATWIKERGIFMATLLRGYIATWLID